MRVPLTNMYGEKMIQYVRCTGEKSWYRQPARRDWVWVKVSKQWEDQVPPYGVLRGCLPYRLLKLFKLTADGGPIWCAFVQTTTPAAGGMPERVSRMVKVTKHMTGSGYAVISGDIISGAAHLIPEEPDCSEILNKAWMVNSHIDLATWNEVY